MSARLPFNRVHPLDPISPEVDPPMKKQRRRKRKAKAKPKRRRRV